MGISIGHLPRHVGERIVTALHHGVIVLGDTESDLLGIGEKVGNGTGPELDVALDPLEGAAICAVNFFFGPPPPRGIQRRKF